MSKTTTTITSTDPDAEKRVRTDVAEGRASGVGRTPTFFVDGLPIVFER